MSLSGSKWHWYRPVKTHLHVFVNNQILQLLRGEIDQWGVNCDSCFPKGHGSSMCKLSYWDLALVWYLEFFHSFCAYIVTFLSNFNVLQFHVTSIFISCLSWGKHISIFWKMESENNIPKFKKP